MTVIVGFLSSISLVLLLGFGWLYLCKLLLPMPEVKLPPGGVSPLSYERPLFPQGQINMNKGPSTERGRRGKALTTLKLLIVVSSFLVVGIIASFFLLPYPTYLVVSWVILIIFLSNILNQELRSYYGIGFEQVLTTIHMTAAKVAHLKRPLITERNPDLRALTDTTAYLKVLRQTFRPVRKKETVLDDQHK